MTGRGAPPAALLEFLGGEAPSANALRQPGSSGSVAGSAPPRPVVPQSSARRCYDDDSSDEDNSAPVYDGGFDNGLDALKAPIPKAEAVPELAVAVAKAEKERTKRPASRGERIHDHQKEQRPPRPRAVPVGGLDTPSSNYGGGYSNGASQTPARGRSFGCTEQVSLGQTSTPFPESLTDMMGEGALHANRRSSSQTPPPQKQLHRSTSGSRSNKSVDSRKNTPEDSSGLGKNGPLALGSSGGKRRFNGRG